MIRDWELDGEDRIQGNDDVLGTPNQKESTKKLLPLREGLLERSENDIEELEEYAGTVGKQAGVVTFEPLDDDGERYLRENMKLPSINDLSLMKFYVNFHPTESDMSSSVNSVDPWWDRLDYDDVEGCECRACRGGSQLPSVQAGEAEVPPQTKARTFPRTEGVMQERRLLEKKTQDQCRAQVIAELERQMRSLYNLKRQYKLNTTKQGCRGEPLSLPPLVIPDKMTRQRDSLLDRIKRKRVEDEVKKQNQIERKLNIVKKLLGEQRRTEFRRKGNFKSRDERKEVTIKPSMFLESVRATVQEREELVEGDDPQAEVDGVAAEQDHTHPTEDVEVGKQDKLEPPGTAGELVTTESPRKASGKKQKDKKKKSLKDSEKKAGKKKKQVSAVEEAPAAICEVEPELPTSQVPDLLLWFENWRELKADRERQIKDLESRKLQLESNVVLNPAKVIFKDVLPGQMVRQLVTVTNVGESLLKCRVAEVLFEDITDMSPILKVALEGPSRARTGNCWTMSLALEVLEDVEDTRVEVRLLFCRGDLAMTQLSVAVEVLTPRAEPALSTSCIRCSGARVCSPNIWRLPTLEAWAVRCAG